MGRMFLRGLYYVMIILSCRNVCLKIIFAREIGKNVLYLQDHIPLLGKGRKLFLLHIF